MISTNKNDTLSFFSESLLDYIIKFIYSGFKCKLLIIGDTAQLPPVNAETSFALDESFIKDNYKNCTFFNIDRSYKTEQRFRYLSFCNFYKKWN